eukprot:CAMPEP_0197526664 /NCGR_PEP_ID=MMETSP1318-20131121/18755_1 /TAXON_ID=552666 /ORGANISM="Partenskyella glossopodia, Strain RCC365" /LENGTH=379 /DNA_ID=CAMNT_0043080939 /DNA_START=21 /DNA_END=1160 /DNA_ORIENTATION=+
MAFDLLQTWAQKLPSEVSTLEYTPNVKKESVGDGNSAKDWAGVKKLSKEFGVDYQALKAFLVGQATNLSPLQVHSDEDRTPVSPLSVASDFDIKSDSVSDFVDNKSYRRKHLFDDNKQLDNKQRQDSKTRNTGVLDSKHRSLYWSGTDVSVDSNLDNKHESKGIKERKETPWHTSTKPLLDSKESKYDPTLPHGLAMFETKPPTLPSDGGTPPEDFLISRLVDNEIRSLPDQPDFGFSSDDEDPDDYKSNSSSTATEPALSSCGSETEPAIFKRVTEYFRRSPVPSEPKTYSSFGESVMHINARQSVLGPEALARLKKGFYKKAVSAGWKKRQRGDDGDGYAQSSPKRARSAESQDFSEKDLQKFCLSIVGCPLCRQNL